MCMCVSDELVDWDPWQPAATAAVVMEGGDDSGPHCDDPDFNVCQHNRIAGKFGGELNLVVWRSIYNYNHQIKIRQNFILAYIRVAIPY